MVLEHKMNAGGGASTRLLQAALEVLVDGEMGRVRCLPSGRPTQRARPAAESGIYDAGAETTFRRGLIQPMAPRTDAALEMLGQGSTP
jgi:hypothetical protein